MIHHASFPNLDVALVLLHGFCENNTCFNKQVLLLKNHCNLVVPNLPGTNQTSKTPANMDEMALLLWAELGALPYTKYILIGHSMGGYAALAMQKLKPKMVVGLGLLHSTALPDTAERKLAREQAIKVIQLKGSGFFVKQFIPPLFYAKDEEQNILALQQQADEFYNLGLIAQINCMKNRADFSTQLAAVPFPVFFGVGKFDNLILPETMLKQAVSANQSYVAYLQNSGHMGHLEQPEQLAEHLLNYYHHIL